MKLFKKSKERKIKIKVSKWSWGALFRHKIFDIPESYGSDISYVKSISKEKAEDLYEKYKDFNKIN